MLLCVYKVNTQVSQTKRGGEKRSGNSSGNHDIGVCVALDDPMVDDTDPCGHLQGKRISEADG